MPRKGDRLQNRLRAVMAHTTRYAFMGASRLAADAGISKSALSRLMAGKSSPSYHVVQTVTAAIEKALHLSVDPRDLVAGEKGYPTKFVCSLSGCRGCLPDAFYEADGTRKEASAHVRPGEWSGNEMSGRGAL